MKIRDRLLRVCTWDLSDQGLDGFMQLGDLFGRYVWLEFEEDCGMSQSGFTGNFVEQTDVIDSHLVAVGCHEEGADITLELEDVVGDNDSVQGD